MVITSLPFAMKADPKARSPAGLGWDFALAS